MTASPTSILSELRNSFFTGETRSYEWRKQALLQLRKVVADPELSEAVRKDLSQNNFVLGVNGKTLLAELDHALSNLKSWMAPEPVDLLGVAFPATGYVTHEPHGVALIIGAWNFPVEVIVRPLIGCIAAGNCAVIKPSEVSVHTSAVFAKLVAQHMDRRFFRVVEGGVEETTALLKLQWDFICYTGNSHVGKIIMRAAAEHLTPVLLELGGKNPTIVTEDANIPVAAKRIAWGKFLNCGQACISPDYVVAHKSVAQQFKTEFMKAIKEFYGENPQNSPDFSRIINTRHVDRLAGLVKGLKEERILCGGTWDEGDKYVAPTLIDNCSFDSSIMADEIFGPILPVIEYEDLQPVLDYINSKPKPLVLYIFSTSTSTHEHIMNKTSSGACLINETMLHFSCFDLPFGGVGNSGVGKYGGKHTFTTFSNKRPVIKQPNINIALRFPPYNDTKISLAKMFVMHIRVKTILFWVLLPFLSALAYFQLRSRL